MSKKPVSPAIRIAAVLINTDAKKVKPSGKVYEVQQRFSTPGRGMPPVLMGYELHECNDGYYIVKNTKSEKLFFRLAPTIINSIIENLKPM